MERPYCQFCIDAVTIANVHRGNVTTSSQLCMMVPDNLRWECENWVRLVLLRLRVCLAALLGMRGMLSSWYQLHHHVLFVCFSLTFLAISQCAVTCWCALHWTCRDKAHDFWANPGSYFFFVLFFCFFSVAGGRRRVCRTMIVLDCVASFQRCESKY